MYSAMLPPSLIVFLKCKYQNDYNYVVIKRFCFLSSVEMLIVSTELIATLIAKFGVTPLLPDCVEINSRSHYILFRII